MTEQEDPKEDDTSVRVALRCVDMFSLSLQISLTLIIFSSFSVLELRFWRIHVS